MHVSAPNAAPSRVAVKDPLGSLGKVIAAVAGAGVFLYVIGVAVLAEGLASAHLHAREVIAALPRDQVAVFGAREALLSAIAGAVFALFLYAFYRMFRFSQQAVAGQGIRGRLLRWMREHPAAVVTAMVASLAVAGPADARGVAFFLLFLANVYLGMRSAHRSLIGELPDFRTSLRPWLRVAAGLAIAVFIASLARQSAFPEQFPVAHIRVSYTRALDLRAVYLPRVNLQNASLPRARLGGADLRGARLVEANLQWASLWRADLQNANLIDADLRNASLVGANLRGARMSEGERHAWLEGAPSMNRRRGHPLHDVRRRRSARDSARRPQS